MDKKTKLKVIKYIPIGILLFVLLFIGYHIMVYISDNSMKTIDDLNKSINIPYQFGEALDKNEMSKRKWTEQITLNTMINYINDEEVYEFSAFPDLSDSYKLTYYYTTSKKVSLFGIRVGGKANKLLRKLKKAGYKVEGLEREYVSFKKGKVHIDFVIESNLNSNYFKKEMLEDGIVSKVTIRLDATDKYYKGYYK